jgi:transcriptional regulator with XRE-family HTH domain
VESIQQVRAEYFKRLLESKPKPRNQVAAISGLSNTYIRELEHGAFANVGRSKIIALAVALDLTIGETDELLALFDRPPLTSADIPTYLDIANQAKIASALYPISSSISQLILFNHVEQIPGRLTIVGDRPTGILCPPDYEVYLHGQVTENGSFYADLVEAIIRKRMHCFSLLLNSYPADQYICRESMDNYVRESKGTRERKWRVQHIENLLWYLRNYDNFNVYLTNVSPRFFFSLKSSANKFEQTDKLIFVSKRPRPFLEARPGRLSGFVTDNQTVIQNFTDELELIKNHTLEEYMCRNKRQAYLEALISVGS